MVPEVTDAQVFEEWQRRWQEDPGSFATAEEHFATPPQTYGERAAAYFAWIRSELEAKA